MKYQIEIGILKGEKKLKPRIPRTFIPIVTETFSEGDIHSKMLLLVGRWKPKWLTAWLTLKDRPKTHLIDEFYGWRVTLID
jgi:hypothetical protein